MDGAGSGGGASGSAGCPGGAGVLTVQVEEDGARSTVRFSAAPVRIGRALDNDLRLTSAKVSRYHCRLVREDGEWWVQDLDSANGLELNGARVQRGRLAAGDELRLGGARLVLLEVGERPDPAAHASEIGLRTALGELGGEGERLPRLASLVRELSRARGADAALRALLDGGVALLGAERGLLLVERGGQPRVRLARTFDGQDLGLAEERISVGLARAALTSPRALLSADARRDERFEALESVERLCLRSVVSAPVEAPIGSRWALLFDHRLRSGHFDTEALRLVELLADLAGLVLIRERQAGELESLRAEVGGLRTQLDALGAERAQAAGDAESPEAGLSRYPAILGRSAAMLELFARLDRVVATQLPVLIHGESGTGKELVARAIHSGGARAAKPFVSENCAALPDSLLASELFGHARGAFTGADRAKKGLIEQADGGTLFLDEIGDMSPQMQQNLLRVLQEGELRPLGSDRRVKVDVRLLAASHRALGELVAKGLFREDLYYRLHVLELRLPPLREREGDLPLLARALLERAAVEAGRRAPVLSNEVLEVLSRHTWPGNVRELENEMRRLAVVAGPAVRLEHLSESVRAGRPIGAGTGGPLRVDGDLRAAVAAFENRAILEALEAHGGNKSRAAAALGITRFALQRKLEKLDGPEPEEDEESG